MVKFIRFKECLKTIEQFLSDKNIAMLETKAKLIGLIGNMIREKPENQLPQDLIKIVNSTYIDPKYLDKNKQSFEFQKKKFKKKLYRE